MEDLTKRKDSQIKNEIIKDLLICKKHEKKEKKNYKSEI
jgi:hypothetical protein